MGTASKMCRRSSWGLSIYSIKEHLHINLNIKFFPGLKEGIKQFLLLGDVGHFASDQVVRLSSWSLYQIHTRLYYLQL